MYKRILVPLDGSRAAEAALAYVTSLATAADVKATILHVVDRADRDCLSLHEAYVERTADYLERLLQRARQQGAPPSVETRVVVGDAAEAILRWAARSSADLIIITRDSRSGRRRWAIGGAASKVLQVSEAPVLLVRAGTSRESASGRWPRTKLILPLDGSELAEMALPHVENLARQWSSGQVSIVAVRVCEPPDLPLLAPPQVAVRWQRTVQEITAECTRSAEAYLLTVAERLRGAGLAATTRVLEGRPAEELLHFAGKGGHNIVVMTTHGRSGIRRWPWGGTAHRVLWGAPFPVMLIRPSDE